jgi:hypothetical protein
LHSGGHLLPVRFQPLPQRLLRSHVAVLAVRQYTSLLLGRHESLLRRYLLQF